MTYSVAPHFLGSCFITQKALRSGPPSRGLHKPSSPSPCLNPQTGVEHDATLTYCFIQLACFWSERRGAPGIEVFVLAARWASAVFICCHVRVIESPVCGTLASAFRQLCQRLQKWRTFLYPVQVCTIHIAVTRIFGKKT